LVDGRVDFIVIGGLAATIHGSAQATFDIDVVYSRKDDNIERLTSVLSPFNPYLRGAPPGLPFRLDAETVRRGLNFTLITTLGELDLLGEVTGGGTYEELLPYSADLEALGVRCRCVTLEKLIHLKRAAGRPRDLNVLAELEAIAEERQRLI
jgi:hypothetical protein